ncbi:MAG: DUF928 domain-containing protein [Limnothrix sp. RL_2_0]|nr:DUF928 domain-containing protein [Limnothrix sp. RL_2_0]
MNRQYLSWPSALVLLGFGSSLAPAIAATPSLEVPAPTHDAHLISQINLPKQDVGSPNSTVGGGKRGGCLTREMSALFRPVLPIDESGTAIANTTSSTPSLWWYVPANSAVKAELSVFTQDNTNDSLVHYQMIDDIGSEAGLLQITLPNNAIKADNSYWWDLTLACDEIDRSGDVYLFGSITRQNPENVSIRRNPAVIDTLITTLLGSDSYLTLDVSEAQELANALQMSTDDRTVTMVESRLRDHFIAVQSDYAQLSQSMQNQNISNAELKNLKQQRSGMMLELAQLSAFFDMWGDTANFLAMGRDEHPEEWQSLLDNLFPQDDPFTEAEEDEIIRVLRMSPSL